MAAHRTTWLSSRRRHRGAWDRGGRGSIVPGMSDISAPSSPDPTAHRPVDLLVVGAELVATMDDERREISGGWIAVTDGLISAIGGPGDPTPQAAKVLRADGCLVTPGLINTHHHIYQNLTAQLPGRQRRLAVHLAHHALPASGPASTRRRPTSRRGSAWSSWRWAAAPPRPTTSTSIPQGAATSSRPRSRPRWSWACASTRPAGSMSLSVKDGGLPPDSVVQDDDDDPRRLASGWWRGGTTRRTGRWCASRSAPCSPFSVTPELMVTTAELAERLDVRLHTHLAEDADEDTFAWRPSAAARSSTSRPWAG